MRAGRDRLHPGQESFDFEVQDGPGPGQALVTGQASTLLINAIRAAYNRLGFAVIDDEVFFQLVLTGLVEPTSRACFAHSAATSGLSLVLYDVTTLYFEAENEDDYCKVGYSKERRVDPQIVVGLLVDRAGFPLEIHAFEGNRAETHTIIPVIQAFRDRHSVADMVIVGDAGMLSATNLQAIDDARLRFIVRPAKRT